MSPEGPVKIRVGKGRITIEADTGELADEARRQPLRVSERVPGVPAPSGQVQSLGAE